ncbi:unnamed protein product [Cuscuta campestris]|uniref:Uncharacterized protein n=1 Tax=Cuscuta campestris TaxID=132261 RepID=A0A484LZS0_9ASTE|nr:unnamed protein product [Cuscuta campestris]
MGLTFEPGNDDMPNAAAISLVPHSCNNSNATTTHLKYMAGIGMLTTCTGRVISGRGVDCLGYPYLPRVGFHFEPVHGFYTAALQGWILGG